MIKSRVNVQPKKAFLCRGGTAMEVRASATSDSRCPAAAFTFSPRSCSSCAGTLLLVLGRRACFGLSRAKGLGVNMGSMKGNHVTTVA